MTYAKRRRRRFIGWVSLSLFVSCVPAANWMIQHVGTQCVPHGPCLIPVWIGISAPSGVLFIGAALVLRDVAQRCLGAWWTLPAVASGAALSVLIAPPALALASGSAFLLSELADTCVYTPLQRRRLVLAVVTSALVGAFLDSAIFLSLAFGSLSFLAGQFIGKAWAVAFAMPLIRCLRRVVPA